MTNAILSAALIKAKAEQNPDRFIKLERLRDTLANLWTSEEMAIQSSPSDVDDAEATLDRLILEARAIGR